MILHLGRMDGEKRRGVVIAESAEGVRGRILRSVLCDVRIQFFYPGEINCHPYVFLIIFSKGVIYHAPTKSVIQIVSQLFFKLFSPTYVDIL